MGEQLKNRKIAALFVMSDGPYANLSDVELWDEVRDARIYPGPHRVVAHPPCERWGRYWHGGPSVKVRKQLGDDDGCFVAALTAVRRYGGVLEHPEASHAWSHHGIKKPPKNGGWIDAGDQIGQTCCVEQGHYGHPARKATWLYVVTTSELPDLLWGPSTGKMRLDQGYHSAEERRIAKLSGTHKPIKRLTKRQNQETPHKFRDLLLFIARS